MLFVKITDNTIDGTPCAVKVARTVWSGGKLGDQFKESPIAIELAKKTESEQQLLCGRALRYGDAEKGIQRVFGRPDYP